MSSIKKLIGGEECECFEFSDPFHGDSGKMRMLLEGTFDGDINRESIVLVPLFLSESELADIRDLWLTEQEKELGLPLGESCTSSGWWVGSSDESKDQNITDIYDFLVPVVLANQDSQHRLQCEIASLFHAQEKIRKELQAEYEDGETDWAAELEVKLDDLERLISEYEELLKQSNLLTIGANVAYCGYSCEVINIENNIVYLQENTSDLHFERSIPAYLDSNPYIFDAHAPKLFIFDDELIVNEDNVTVNGYLWAVDALVDRLPFKEDMENINFFAEYNVVTGVVTLAATYDTPSADGELNKMLQVALSEEETAELISAMESYCKTSWKLDCLEYVNSVRSFQGLDVLVSKIAPVSLDEQIAAVSGAECRQKDDFSHIAKDIAR